MLVLQCRHACLRFQVSLYGILPPTTAIIGYYIYWLFHTFMLVLQCLHACLKLQASLYGTFLMTPSSSCCHNWLFHMFMVVLQSGHAYLKLHTSLCDILPPAAVITGYSIHLSWCFNVDMPVSYSTHHFVTSFLQLLP